MTRIYRNGRMVSPSAQALARHDNPVSSSIHCAQEAQQTPGLPCFGPCTTPPDVRSRLARGNINIASYRSQASLAEFPTLNNSAGSEFSTGSKSRVRRRISRACDRCSQRRTKCDGRHPSNRHKENDLSCAYAREKKKRGKGSDKYLARHDAISMTPARAAEQRDSLLPRDPEPMKRNSSQVSANLDYVTDNGSQDSLVVDFINTNKRQIIRKSEILENNGGVDSETSSSGYISCNHHLESGTGTMGSLWEITGQSGLPGVENGWSDDGNGSEYLTDHDLIDETLALGLLDSQSKTTSSQLRLLPFRLQTQTLTTASFRYPVLGPLVPHLEGIMSVYHAGDLLEYYFSSSLSTHMHPTSPHVLGFVFRKRAFMHLVRPRKCKPALLASILWTAAQTSDSNFLTGSPNSRVKVCKSLLDLTIRLLSPLRDMGSKGGPEVNIHSAEGTESRLYNISEPAGVETSVHGSSAVSFAGELDDVATYAHIATVISASEYKGASIRWWNNAWSLARELDLGREITASASPLSINADETGSEDLDQHDMLRGRHGYVSEEEREERRRLWWLLYMVDRHTALCYNRALSLLDADCEGLLQPMDENKWQNGEFECQIKNSPNPNYMGYISRPPGSQVECTGNSIFGFFLPLMTILGEIVDLRHMKNHPRFGTSLQVPNVQTLHFWDQRTTEIRRHLQAYELSLQSFQGRKKTKEDNGSSAGQTASADQPTSRIGGGIPDLMAVTYGTFVLHVLHILLECKWDPIDLLDNSDHWISTTSFVTTTSHAMSAAEAVDRLLELDPGLNFMPLFLGIYLFQGSLLPLLVVEKLTWDTSAEMIKACETMLRRNFSKVMRTTLSIARRRWTETATEHQRRRELLGLYRWNYSGTGLAL
ncbi:transcriptional activator xlnR [Purpureocillium lilacinum]|uniref:Transcriptional activator xlnR n=1 Tax=Purpureocillium lilacinum TaxID=33203 RepID=A0A179F036_PURLI|nr:transcriptional activator xlnR [Purpureocillium lilacinum]